MSENSTRTSLRIIMQNASPSVTAVIPTRNRPELVLRAVRSALDQTYANLNVIVVIDGPDPTTESALRSFVDDRVKVLSLPQPLGGCGARNAGIEAATSNWIALLDDDDEWLPSKIEAQMQRAEESGFTYPVVASQLLARIGNSDLTWPRRQPYEPLSEYLLARNSWSYGEGLLQASTLLAQKELFKRVPFRSGLSRHQDLDWILRVAQHAGAGIEFVPMPLSIWHLDHDHASVGKKIDWKSSLEWVDSVRPLLTRRAYAGFVATYVSSQAARAKDCRQFGFLCKRLFTWGKPTPRDVLLFAAMWFTPYGLRRAVRRANK
jgi:glycosyltransferase involved in cell wall biosynthesis